jgi:hypothetical protein
MEELKSPVSEGDAGSDRETAGDRRDNLAGRTPSCNGKGNSRTPNRGRPQYRDPAFPRGKVLKSPASEKRAR